MFKQITFEEPYLRRRARELILLQEMLNGCKTQPNTLAESITLKKV